MIRVITFFPVRKTRHATFASFTADYPRNSVNSLWGFPPFPLSLSRQHDLQCVDDKNLCWVRMSLILFFFQRVLEKSFCIKKIFWFTPTSNSNTYFIARYRLRKISFQEAINWILINRCVFISYRKIFIDPSAKGRENCIILFWLNASTNKSHRLAVAIFKSGNIQKRKWCIRKGLWT